MKNADLFSLKMQTQALLSRMLDRYDIHNS